MSITKYTVLASFLIFHSVSFAGFESSKNEGAAISVKAAKELKDKDYVTLEGKILSKIRKEKFAFSDGKDEICIEIDDKIMPTQKFDENTPIRIKGEVDKEFKAFGDRCDKIKIDVETIEILNKK